MSKKAKPTKTLNPLHFEDLDPHRFEDLVRNLIYDFKRWKSIEATGRADQGRVHMTKLNTKDSKLTRTHRASWRGTRISAF